METLTDRATDVPPCAELRTWFAERLRPQLVEAVRRGQADAASVAQLELDMRSMIEGASPCRDDLPPAIQPHQASSG